MEAAASLAFTSCYWNWTMIHLACRPAGGDPPARWTLYATNYRTLYRSRSLTVNRKQAACGLPRMLGSAAEGSLVRLAETSVPGVYCMRYIYGEGSGSSGPRPVSRCPPV